MKTIELQIDDQTFEQVQRLAEARQSSLQVLIVEISNRLPSCHSEERSTQRA